MIKKTILFMIFATTTLLLLQGISYAQQVPVTPGPTPTSTAVALTAQAGDSGQPQGFLEKYGVIAAVFTVLGGIIVVVFQKLLGPILEVWGNKLRDRLKGEDQHFRELYIPALTGEHKALKLVGFSKEGIGRPELKEVYVSLRVNDPHKQNDRTSDQPLSVVEAVIRHKNLVVLGEPGAGKSTLLDWLILVSNGQIFHPALQNLSDLLPIYLPLRACTSDDRDLDVLMTDKDLLPLTIPAPATFFTDQLKKGRCLVLLDGLDEVLDTTARDNVAKKVKRLADTYPDNRYIVTCRTAGWKESLLSNEFTRVLIQDFEPEETQRFITGWYRAVRRLEVTKRVNFSEVKSHKQLAEAEQTAQLEAEQLIAALDANFGLSELARNPLILSLIALVSWRRTKLPKGRTKLYQECLEILLDVWDKVDKNLNIEGLSPNAKETILRTIAYAMYRDGQTEASSQTLQDQIASMLPTLDCKLSKEEVLRQIEERSGILVTRAADSYVFAHRTLQEYLVAKVLKSDPNSSAEILLHLTDEPWREIILLYVGMTEDATTLIRAIMQQPDDEAGNMLFLAGQCLTEDVRVDASVRTAVVAAVEQTFNQTADTVKLERFGRLLAGIGGVDVTEIFGRVLREGFAPQQVSATRALGRLGAKHPQRAGVALQLTAALQAGNAALRRSAALSLAELGHADDAVLTALEHARQDEEMEVRGAALWAALELGRADVSDMIRVPAGDFLMGSGEDDPMAEDDEKPQHRVYLDTFYIARYPVTNAEFQGFVQATGYKAYYWEHPGKAYDNHPAADVSWRDASAYAVWLGAQLPSEAQWEKAASWDATHGVKRRWPWSDRWEGGRRNTDYDKAQSVPGSLFRGLLKRPGSKHVENGTTTVGQYSPAGDSPYGCADMAGNVWEWCNSLYRPYPYAADDGREDLVMSGGRVLRGGSWYDYHPVIVRCAFRTGYYPDLRNYIGFRVARSSLK